jgi:hypothetical protein
LGVSNIFATFLIVDREKTQNGLTVLISYPDSIYETVGGQFPRYLLSIRARFQETVNDIGACVIITNLGSDVQRSFPQQSILEVDVATLDLE